jgi:pSer/pThr/pTyr-binding forkhead associated (FHA) protein
VFLDDITVSRNHAEVRETTAGHVLVDLGSTNGSYVNRRLIDGDELLAEGDEVQVGKFRLVFVP